MFFSLISPPSAIYPYKASGYDTPSILDYITFSGYLSSVFRNFFIFSQKIFLSVEKLGSLNNRVGSEELRVEINSQFTMRNAQSK